MRENQRARTDTSAFAIRLNVLHLASLNRTERCAVFLFCGGGNGGIAKASPVNRTMPGKRVLPTVACEFAATTLKGLGDIRPAFSSAFKRISKEVCAGSLAQSARKADNQTI